MITKRLAHSLLVLALISFFFGCTTKNGTPKTEKTWIDKIEGLTGGQTLVIGGIPHYPIGSKVKRYYVFVLKNEKPEMRTLDIYFKMDNVIDRIELVDIDESDIIETKLSSFNHSSDIKKGIFR